MATHASALKRTRQNKKRRVRNTHVKTTTATRIRKVMMAIEQKDIEGAQKALVQAIPLIQKAQVKGIYHKNTASRKISRLTLKVNALKK